MKGLRDFQWLVAVASSACVILAWTLVYYVTSALSTLWNKNLVDDGGVSVTVLTLLHLLVSLSSDIAIMRYSGEGLVRFSAERKRHRVWDIVLSFTPISVFVILSKLTTYLSYKHVSVSLSHTAKASEPIFNVVVAALVFKEYRSRLVYLSLVPIAVGVMLASVTDLSFTFIGFFWSVVSALMKVLQNIYTKRLMSTGRYTFWEIHLYCGAASLAILLPVLLLQAATASANPFSHFPVFSLFACSLLQYVSSVASYKVLHLVSHLTYTIVNVLKRLVVIITGNLLAQHAMGVLNTAGVVLAVFGIFAYNVFKDVAPSAGPTNLLSARSWLAWLQGLAWRYNHMAEPQEGSEKLSSGAGATPGGFLTEAPPPSADDWRDGPGRNSLDQTIADVMHQAGGAAAAAGHRPRGGARVQSTAPPMQSALPVMGSANGGSSLISAEIDAGAAAGQYGLPGSVGTPLQASGQVGRDGELASHRHVSANDSAPRAGHSMWVGDSSASLAVFHLGVSDSQLAMRAAGHAGQTASAGGGSGAGWHPRSLSTPSGSLPAGPGFRRFDSPSASSSTAAAMDPGPHWLAGSRLKTQPSNLRPQLQSHLHSYSASAADKGVDLSLAAVAPLQLSDHRRNGASASSAISHSGVVFGTLAHGDARPHAQPQPALASTIRRRSVGGSSDGDDAALEPSDAGQVAAVLGGGPGRED